MTAIFISHSSRDNDAAARLVDWLREQGHSSLFLDFDPDLGIPGGVDWEQRLYQQLRQCQAVIALLSENWLASRWCFAEVVIARDRGKPVLPVKIAPCDAGTVFPALQQIDLSAGQGDGYGRLARGLKEHGLDPEGIFDWDPTRAPYPGLLAFQAQDAAIFRGRSRETLEACERLAALRRRGRSAPRLALIVGASGSGKSSLLRAGILPRLRRSPEPWLPLRPFRPQGDPLGELAAALLQASEGAWPVREWANLRERLAAGGDALRGLARELRLITQRDEATLLVSVDQAEELFAPATAAVGEGFRRLLRATLDAADQDVMVLATIRSDMLGALQADPILGDPRQDAGLRFDTIPLGPVPVAAFSDIIRGPARLAGLEVEDALVDAMVRDTGTPDALPLLAFTLRRLHDQPRRSNRLELAAYRDLGGLEASIGHVVRELAPETTPEAELLALRAAFVPRLVQVGAEGAFVRRRALRAEMPAGSRPLLQALVDARLLVADRDPAGQETIEIAHEALLRRWPLLASWLEEDRDALRRLDGLRRAAAEWDERGRPDELLLHRDGRLREVSALVAEPRFTPAATSPASVYLAACRRAQAARAAAAEARHRRELEQARAFAEEQRLRAEAETRRRIEATSRQLAAQALALRDGQLDLACLLAAEATRTAPTFEARSALFQLLAASPRLLSFLQSMIRPLMVGAKPWREQALSFSRDGRLLAAPEGLDSARVCLWDVAARRLHRPPLDAEGGAVRALGFSPDGRLLAAVTENGIVTFWDTASWERSGPPLDGRAVDQEFAAFGVTSLAWEAGGGLAVIGHRPLVLRWNVAGRRLAEVVALHTVQGVQTIAAAPDGERLAVTGQPEGGGPYRTALLSYRHGTWHEETVAGEAPRFGPDGDELFVVDDAGSRIKVYRTSDLTLLRSLAVPFQIAGGSMAISADGTRLAVAGRDIALCRLDAAGQEPALLHGHVWYADGLAFAPDGDLLASTSAEDAVLLWSTERRSRLARVLVPPEVAQAVGWLHQLRFSRSGAALLCGSDERTMICDAAGGTVRADLGIGIRLALTLPDGWCVIDRTGALFMIGAAPPHRVAAIAPGALKAGAAAAAPDGRSLYALDEHGFLHRVDRPAGAVTRLLPERSFPGDAEDTSRLACAPDGTLLAVVDDAGEVQLIDVATGTCSGEPLATGMDSCRLAFTLTGDRLLITGRESYQIWSVADRTPLVRYSTGSGLGAPGLGAISPAGELVAWTTLHRRPVQLLDGRGGQAFGPPLTTAEGDGVTAFDFAPDGRTLATAGDAGIVCWDLDPASWLMKARALANRNLTREEWRRFLADAPYGMTFADLDPG